MTARSSKFDRRSCEAGPGGVAMARIIAGGRGYGLVTGPGPVSPRPIERGVHRPLPGPSTSAGGSAPRARLETSDPSLTDESCDIWPDPGSQASQSGGPQRRRLHNVGPLDWHVEDVRLELHEPVVLRRPTIDPQPRERAVAADPADTHRAQYFVRGI